MEVENKPTGQGRTARRSTAATTATPVAGAPARTASSSSEALKPSVSRPARRAVAAPAAPTPSPARLAAEPGARSDAWGQGLAAYPDWVQRYLPALHDGFNALNKYVSVPALKAGLGRYMSTPLMGYLMILRTRGRKSGEMRDAPLGYCVVGDAVYLIAGFGRKTHWFQNVNADPRVEVILPSQAFSGLAEEVTDMAERRRVLPILLRSMGLVAVSLGMGNPWQMTPDEMEAKCQGLPLVRVRATGIAAGPEDPGGWYWVVPIAASSLLVFLWWRGRKGARRAASSDR
jgi:deazaflavin-dependent oxidoreductase (nitroreductase family)